MKIISEYVRELQRYSKSELAGKFMFNDTEVCRFIKNLKAYGIIKSVKMSSHKDLSELSDDELVIEDGNGIGDNCLYVFAYVGIITYGSRIIKVYPKYLKNDEPLKEMKQAIKVLEKYDRSSEQIIRASNASDENYSFNMLALMLYLLNDYYEYGTYSNEEDVIGTDGNGEILWEKTINESIALIKDNRPYYTELYSRKLAEDNFDYIRRLHECVLTECSEHLHNSQLDVMFDIEQIYLSDEKLFDFGDNDYILYRIEQELNIQFNTRRQVLLKTLYAYISADSKLFENETGVSMFGTTSYHTVWEKVCSEVFDNKLDIIPDKCGFTVTAAGKGKSLKNLIDAPIWKINGQESREADTLIPDIVSIYSVNDEKRFVILDAKYYCLDIDGNGSLPGVGDITKQYFYRLAYQKFIEDNDIKTVRNCFLMPSSQNGSVKIGYVTMDMFASLGLDKILVIQLSADDIYERYLHNSKFDTDSLEKLICD